MKLKFKVQAYQSNAVAAFADCFAGQPQSSGVRYRIDPGAKSPTATHPTQLQLIATQHQDLSDAGFKNAELVLNPVQLLENIQLIQRRQNLPVSTALVGDKSTGCALNLVVEMETGTGKTYCYIKSMFELNKRYGWSKFIVVVPSIAIREGVFKSLEITAEHFLESYGKKARFFIYNSKSPHHLESFSSDAGINVMVINVQAFNATGKDNRRIYEELDDFQSRRPIDVIKANRPILILDEPQKMEGGKTLDSLKHFNPLIDRALLGHPQDRLQQDPSPRRTGCLQPEAGEKDRRAWHYGARSDRYARLSLSRRHRNLGKQAAGGTGGAGNPPEQWHQTLDAQARPQ